MQTPLEIAFHNIDAADWAKQDIAARVEKLEEIYGRLTGARVRVDQGVKAGNGGGIPPVVRIELSVPGHKDIVVAHEPEHLTQKFQNPDLRQAIAESFHLAERRLIAFKEKQQGRTKTHTGGTASPVRVVTS